jgi:hypothetical protein
MKREDIYADFDKKEKMNPELTYLIFKTEKGQKAT